MSQWGQAEGGGGDDKEDFLENSRILSCLQSIQKHFFKTSSVFLIFLQSVDSQRCFRFFFYGVYRPRTILHFILFHLIMLGRALMSMGRRKDNNVEMRYSSKTNKALSCLIHAQAMSHNCSIKFFRPFVSKPEN